MSARNTDISYSDVAKGEGPAAKRQAAVQAQLQAQQQAAELSEKISTVAKTNHQSPTLPRGKNPFQIAAKRAQQRKKRRLLGGRGGAGAGAGVGGGGRVAATSNHPSTALEPPAKRWPFLGQSAASPPALQHSSSSADEFMMAAIYRRTTGSKPGRAGRTRDVLQAHLAQLNGEDHEAILAKCVAQFLNGMPFDVERLPTGCRDPDAYQNAATLTDDDGIYEKNKSERGIYDMQVVVTDVPSAAPSVKAMNLLKALGLPASPTVGCRGKRDIGKTRDKFESRKTFYTATKKGGGSSSNKKTSQNLVAAMEAWPGLTIDVVLVPVWVANEKKYDNEESFFTVMECLADCLTHAGPTPGNAGPVVQSYRGVVLCFSCSR